MLDYVKSFEFTSTLAILVYWVPAAICFVVYFFRCIGLYKKDMGSCGERYYTPELTIGTILWFVLASVTPCANLFALVFDCLASVFKWLGAFFDIPLVPKRRDTTKEAA